MSRARENGAGRVLTGLVAGTVVGASLGLLFAPKKGVQLRRDISDGANAVGRNVSDGYRKVADAAGTVAGKGQHLYGQARRAVARSSASMRKFGRQAQVKMRKSPPLVGAFYSGISRASGLL